jgi:AcrR family transcriptional regulator
MAASAAARKPGRHLRADAARNRQLLIEAAAEVFAARGLDATLDEIARHAGVNVATAYRNFSSKHELAREFLQRCIDQAVAIAEEAAAAPDPWQGLGQFLERSVDHVTSNRALVDLVTHAHGFPHAYHAELFDQLQERISRPLEGLLARGRQAGVVRADIAPDDFFPMLHMLTSFIAVGAPGIPDLPRRYTSLVLAALRPGGAPLSGKPPARGQLRAIVARDADEAAHDQRTGSRR